jgi:NADH-quinone oxidoreductase subunit J
MTALQVLFLIVALVTIFSAIMVVSIKNLFHAALWLILALLGVAAFFAMLEASFFAAVQLLVYIGAIAILIIFAIMLTRHIMTEEETQVNRLWGIAIILIAVLFAIVISQISSWPGFSELLMNINSTGQGNIVTLGEALVSPNGYALPFETASVLLLAALLGGVYVAVGQKEGKKS